MQNIVVFGGSFDPFHLGHLSIIQNLLKRGAADQVWILPVGKHTFDKNLTDSKHRLAMIEIGLRNLTPELQKRVRVDLTEIDNPDFSITIDTLDHLAKKYPDCKFSFVMGSDNLAKFELWDYYQEMIEKYSFLVYPRANFDFQPWYPQMIKLDDFPIVEVSSTRIKKRLQDGEEIGGLVSVGVEKYINKFSLYR